MESFSLVWNQHCKGLRMSRASKKDKDRKKQSKGNGKQTAKELSPVVNVNKDGRDGKKDQDKFAKNAKATARVATQAIADMPRAVKKARLVDNLENKRTGHAGKAFETSFCEGDKMLKMAVSPAEESEFPGQVSESDDEVNTSQVSSQISGENGNEILDVTSADLTELDEEMGEIQDEEDLDLLQERRNGGGRTVLSEKTSRSQCNDDQIASTSAEIRKLDQEMKEKLGELHRLISGGLVGLPDTAEMALHCTRALEEKQQQHCDATVTVGQGAKGINHNSNEIKRKSTKGAGRCPYSNKLVQGGVEVNHSRSIETIYEPAVPKHTSSSSEEDGEILNTSVNPRRRSCVIDDPIDKQIELVIAEARQTVSNTEGIEWEVVEQFDTAELGKATGGERERSTTPVRQQVEIGAIQRTPQFADGRRGSHRITPEERVQEMVRQAEAAKAKLFATPGKDDNFKQFLSPTAVVDEGYFVVGAHLDEAMVEKIGRGEYVDFGKFIPKDRVMAEEDCRLKMVIKNGWTFWSPVGNAVFINSFVKLEQAFQVFSNIYCKANPHRAAELI